jgi:hypothetical protein
MKPQISIYTLGNVGYGLMFLPPLVPSFQRRGRIVTRDIMMFEKNVKLVL